MIDGDHVFGKSELLLHSSYSVEAEDLAEGAVGLDKLLERARVRCHGLGVLEVADKLILDPGLHADGDRCQ